MTHLSAATGGTRSAADPVMSKSGSAQEGGGEGGKGVRRGGVEGILREKGRCGREGLRVQGVGGDGGGILRGGERDGGTEEEKKYDNEEKKNGDKQKEKEEV